MASLMNNPYAPPQSPPQPLPKQTRFFTPLAVAVHAAIFPWLGAVLAAINFRRLGNGAAALRTLLIYAGPAVAIHVITIVASKAPLAIAFRILSLALAVMLYREQRVVVMPRLMAGAAPGRWYLVWIALLPIFFVTLVAWQFLSPIPKP
jgi:hypothetical protein